MRSLVCCLCIPDFCSCHFRFIIGRHRVHPKETDVTLRKRSSPSKAARHMACCLGWSPSVTTHSTSEWSTGKGRARPALTEPFTLQKEVGNRHVSEIQESLVWPERLCMTDGPVRNIYSGSQMWFFHSTHKAGKMSLIYGQSIHGTLQNQNVAPECSFFPQNFFLHFHYLKSCWCDVYLGHSVTSLSLSRLICKAWLPNGYLRKMLRKENITVSWSWLT
jgi:hypothetical protein